MGSDKLLMLDDTHFLDKSRELPFNKRLKNEINKMTLIQLVALHSVILKLYHLSSISKDVPELILEYNSPTNVPSQNRFNVSNMLYWRRGGNMELS